MSAFLGHVIGSSIGREYLSLFLLLGKSGLVGPHGVSAAGANGLAWRLFVNGSVKNADVQRFVICS